MKGRATTPELAAEIVTQLQAGKTMNKVAKELGCSLGAVRNVRAAQLPETVPPPSKLIHLDLVRKGGVFLLVASPPSDALSWIVDQEGSLILGARDLQTLRGALRMMQEIVATAGRDLKREASATAPQTPVAAEPV